MVWCRDLSELRYSPLPLDQSLPRYLPEDITLREILRSHVNFRAIPRRSFFQYLRHFSKNEEEKERLDEFLSVEGAVGNPLHLTSVLVLTRLL
jgi:sulfite reductase alpha subunit-like flavoprotein